MNPNIQIPQIIAPFRMWLNESLQANQTQNAKSLYESRPLNIFDSFFVVRSNSWIYYVGLMAIVFYVMRNFQSPTWDTSFLVIAICVFYVFFVQEQRKDENYTFDIIHKLNFIGNVMFGSGVTSFPIFTKEDYELRNFYDANTLNYFANYPSLVTFFNECRDYATVHLSAYRNALLEMNVFCKLDFMVRNVGDIFPDKGEVIQNMYHHLNDALDQYQSIYYNLDPTPEKMKQHEERIQQFHKIAWTQFKLTYQWIIKQTDYSNPTTFTMWDNMDFIMARNSSPATTMSTVDQNHFGIYSKL